MRKEYEYLADQVETLSGLISRAEAAELIAQSLKAPKNTQFVELGPYLGKSTAAICSIATRFGIPLITIDDFHFRAHWGPSNPSKIRANLKKFGPTDLTIIKSDSAVVPDCINKVGFLFTDTEHTDAKLTQELGVWTPYMVKGTILSIHDYELGFPGLIAAVDRLLRNNTSWEYLGRVGTLITFRKKG